MAADQEVVGMATFCRTKFTLGAIRLKFVLMTALLSTLDTLGRLQ